MRHRKALRKFGLPSDQRRALLKGLCRSMILNDRIVTTETRAKEVRPIVEKLVTMARKGGAEAPVAARLHTRRMVRRYVDSNVDEFVKVPGGKNGGKKISRNPHYAIPRLFEIIAPRYMDRNGGYTRITKIGFRRGDAAPLVLLEFVEGVEEIPVAPVEKPAKAEKGKGILGRRKKEAAA
jgi:large subunit ribosomal protein L17